MAKGDRLGRRLVRSTTDCAAATVVLPECRSLLSTGPTGGTVTIKGQPLERSVRSLSMAVERAIVHETRLAGTFNVELRWSSGDASRTSDAPDIFTAVREQLGLQLKSSTGPVEMVVIDRVELPVNADRKSDSSAG